MKQDSGNYHALVVDDNLDYQQIFRMALEFAGYDVTVASNGKDAIEALEGGRFYALFLDLNMPIMDGTALLRTITAPKKYPTMYIVVLTANSERTTSEVEEASDFVMMKPIDVGELSAFAARLKNVQRQAETKES